MYCSELSRHGEVILEVSARRAEMGRKSMLAAEQRTQRVLRVRSREEPAAAQVSRRAGSRNRRCATGAKSSSRLTGGYKWLRGAKSAGEGAIAAGSAPTRAEPWAARLERNFRLVCQPSDGDGGPGQLPSEYAADVGEGARRSPAGQSRRLEPFGRRVMAARKDRQSGGKPRQSGAAFRSVPWPPEGYRRLRHRFRALRRRALRRVDAQRWRVPFGPSQLPRARRWPVEGRFGPDRGG